MISGKKTPTIQDVARHASVSAATVSRVLSSPERVSETTRERVTAAVRETGYTINQAARSLRLKAARTILMAAPNIGNPFYSTIVDAVLSEAAARGYSVLVASSIGDDPNLWLRDYLLSTRADGLLLFDGSLDTKRLHGLDEGGVSLPLVAAYDEIPDPEINSVITDNRLAAKRAIRHLVELGHRRIGHVTFPSRNGTTNERLIGYHEAMTEAGLETHPEWMALGNYNMPSGAAAAEQLLALKQRPTAVFCANDEMAIGFVHQMRKAGVECPRDISVIGFDDITVAEYFDPPLTTMRQPREQIGRMATRSLIDIIEGIQPEDEPVHLVLMSDLIVRKSTRAI
ncbi:LacI family DNA-binding transcriptional regulator [Devosia sp. ZB163]|uniref:LacI family DNA-binding transcriptional regulator n=1 Tax=Devosia sp. ZB163 TaxID=3025938 RepID=UPI002362B7CD|nr:LacI family DNA-binding transcriptional regulator [Devosia sp. ZB163]MDC9824176.1 LacI family DNA-binding transcriptional regulator [Devosia sp. ZB163]